MIDEIEAPRAQVSLDFFKKKGYRPKTPWMWIGHCNGIAPHENPDIAIGVESKLEIGMHFCIEPTITDFTSAGVRHSDQFIMTEKGAERLTPVSWELYK